MDSELLELKRRARANGWRLYKNPHGGTAVILGTDSGYRLLDENNRHVFGVRGQVSMCIESLSLDDAKDLLNDDVPRWTGP